ncbi:MAG TPA: PRC-barrel domain-containing protein, partial [Anaerolineales bacterium]|nr:PRC-barrel domain-containing protein [Anaerolineales bacterium]
MRKITLLLSTLILSAMVLAACGGGPTSTNVAPTVPPITAEVTEPATEVPTEMPTEPMATETAGVPVTGEINPARVSNQMQFNVVDQTGNQVGTAQDMILDLDNTSVAYVIVNAGSALGTGREVAVPWGMLQLQTGAGTGTGTGTEATAAPTDAGTGEATAAPTDAGGIATVAPTDTDGMATGEATSAPTDAGMATAAPTDTGAGMGISGENVFVLQTDPSALDNAPEFDPGTLPQMGQSASGWDAALLSYWQGAGTGTGSGAQATTAPEMTATTDTGTGGTGTTGTATAVPTDASGAGTATAAPTDASGAGMGTGTQGIGTLQGVALASDVIGSTVTVNSMGTGSGTGTEATAAPTDAMATAAPTDASGAGAATSAPTDASGAGTGTGMAENVSGTVEDLIVDTDSGDILYVVFNATLDGGERVVPVPVSMFQWDAGTQGLVLNMDAATLQDAPNFEDGQFPDTTMSGWNSEIDSFWQNNGGSSGENSGSGSGGEAT